MVRGVGGHVDEERREGTPKGFPIGVLVLDDAGPLSRRQRLQEPLLLALERGPDGTDSGQSWQLAAAERPRRAAFPAAQPEPVGSVDVTEHPRDGGMAELLADVAARDPVTDSRHEVEEPVIGPPVIAVELLHPRDGHDPPSFLLRGWLGSPSAAPHTA